MQLCVFRWQSHFSRQPQILLPDTEKVLIKSSLKNTVRVICKIQMTSLIESWLQLAENSFLFLRRLKTIISKQRIISFLEYAFSLFYSTFHISEFIHKLFRYILGYLYWPSAKYTPNSSVYRTSSFSIIVCWAYFFKVKIDFEKIPIDYLHWSLYDYYNVENNQGKPWGRKVSKKNLFCAKKLSFSKCICKKVNVEELIPLI